VTTVNPTSGRARRFLVVAATLLFVAAGCAAPAAAPDSSSGSMPSGDDGRTLHILVVNDDGVDAPGIDALVEGLHALPDVQIEIVAPVENKSGTGSSRSTGEVLVVRSRTASGVPAWAVTGFPVDAVAWALDGSLLSFVPDLVVSGINDGANYSLEVVPHSGTLGAAREAALRGLPALAVSSGRAEPTDFPAAVKLAVAWVVDNRERILAGAGNFAPGGPAAFWSLNVPSCAPGTSLRGMLEVPAVESLGDTEVAVQNCASDVAPESVTGDVSGFQNGWAVLVHLSATDLTAVPPVGASLPG